MKYKIPLIVFFVAVILIIGFAIMQMKDVSETKNISEINIDFELIAQGFTSPVDLVYSPDDTRRIFVVDRIGIIKIINSENKLIDEPFIDLQDKVVELKENYDERGLLGLAFHPDFEENGRFFVYYSAPLRDEAPKDWDHTGIISEFKISENRDKADESSERIIMEIDEPQLNHNGGQINFGKDGYLYIALGDGGNANDVGLGHPENGNGQNISTLLGSILRIDVDNEEPYAIPSDNPFANKDGRDEIYAYGFRNPFRFSFDGEKLFVADVGQNLWEEVNIVEKGKNYGWNIKEGNHCFDANNPDESPKECESLEKLADPIIEYKHEGEGITGKAIIGGFVYRGEIQELYGKYVFADWSNSFTNSDGALLIAEETDGKWEIIDSIKTNSFVLAMGRDADNEIYLLTSDNLGPNGETGKVYKIVEKNIETENYTDVEIKGFEFAPAIIKIKKGETIKWTNKDSVKHTVTSDDELFDSGLFSKGESWSHTFDDAGNFSYYCIPHPYMKGIVIVE